MLNFHEMERKFGTAAAYHCLLEIEKAAGIVPSSVDGIDPEVRLQNACRVQDKVSHIERVA